MGQRTRAGGSRATAPRTVAATLNGLSAPHALGPPRDTRTVTNGGAYTAGTVRLAVPTMLRRLALKGMPLERARVGVVGANGVVGFGICRSLLADVGALVEPGVTGFLIDRDDNLGLAAALVRLAGDPALAERMGAEGRSRVEQRYSLQRLEENLRNLYQDVRPTRNADGSPRGRR